MSLMELPVKLQEMAEITDLQANKQQKRDRLTLLAILKKEKTFE